MSLSVQRYLTDERLRVRLESDARRERAEETHRLLALLVGWLRGRRVGPAAGRRGLPEHAACAHC